MKTSYMAYAAVCLILSSCVADLDLNVKNADKTYLVVDGMITNESKAHCITLSTSSPFFGEYVYNPVKGAEVTISDGTIPITLTESNLGGGEYFTPDDWHCVQGKAYTLTVRTGQEEVSGVYQASSAMPEKGAEYEKMDYYYDKEAKSWIFKVWIRDYPGIISYYAIFAELNGCRMENMVGTQNGNSYMDGFYLDGANVASFSAEDLGRELESGDVVSLYFCCAPKEYYDFYYALTYSTQTQLPLLMPQPGNCPTNIGGGDALGFFSACYVEPLSVTITDPYKPE